ncbi:small, acid-soluble spore protein K [Salipaludibacillus agaradhaerens]|uniref:Small, acid-soluble spore protein K n=1 Tax=Salipaludibacillus agaradhaerens TaxID=76935 RepID=A0A9Q4FZX9_SALAG|nr:small acid-soluble spore protein K [Salipaludibacillus agaradhaerens]MCR6110023.1 small, acid-soluble spore protein K [Bacillus sp. A301a_S52]UJW57126.1 small, acid-soluble spore protein K [Bacillus sp. A116_S68]MCR6097219.1 small, acid-soluble spore protein K [Salipaludibacillus agaradhaerens]MCR6105959.1 small, acid-soluble spore protein K [Salipaludibacillus agaradhaerens]MCR6113296.1 small, acid-soluble spore protein K [Salipaludibacillus agaradhaerens]
MRNNNRDLPSRISLDKGRHDMSRFASKRPDGSIKDHPKQRMAASSEKQEDDI